MPPVVKKTTCMKNVDMTYKKSAKFQWLRFSNNEIRCSNCVCNVIKTRETSDNVNEHLKQEKQSGPRHRDYPDAV